MRTFLLLFMSLLLPTTLFSQDTCTTSHSVVSSYDFDETLKRLKVTFEEKNLTLFAEIDHTAHAEKVGLPLTSATVLLVGNPKAGTPLMQQNVEIAIELPLKILVFKKEGTAQVYVHFKKLVPLAKQYFSSNDAKLHASLKQIENTMIRLIEQTVMEK
ncbi:hypothetical protein CGC54_08410 [Capnocytophaga canimorsus]|uniref:DUF302 domain-containing protein n=1 Tax=Capnocytophaga canimorsus TaxID=28188 RepID=A0AAC9Z4B9_9FLAO|nr:DUF302 domain-containing protein [Capnocytophaga canimorsus]ATA94348.1 hypothetical protein CGC54_08410 [Capnocytophaga canimorsus]